MQKKSFQVSSFIVVVLVTVSLLPDGVWGWQWSVLIPASVSNPHSGYANSNIRKRNLSPEKYSSHVCAISGFLPFMGDKEGDGVAVVVECKLRKEGIFRVMTLSANSIGRAGDCH